VVLKKNFVSINIITLKLVFVAELGDYDLAEHSPELVSEFRFVPIQTEEMELAIFEKWKEYRYLSFDYTSKTSP
jgi:hypothetical protein